MKIKESLTVFFAVVGVAATLKTAYDNREEIVNTAKTFGGKVRGIFKKDEEQPEVEGDSVRDVAEEAK